MFLKKQREGSTRKREEAKASLKCTLAAEASGGPNGLPGAGTASRVTLTRGPGFSPGVCPSRANTEEQHNRG